jgi:DNA repair protein RadD
MIELREYQGEAIEAVLGYWSEGGGNPLVEMATGTGKSVVIAGLNKHLLENYEGLRVLMLTHVRELVAQNAQALLRVWPQAPVGINSAGLNRRDRFSQILFASVQSVYKIGDQLGPRDVVMVDESHLVPRDGDGMYRTLLETLRRERPDLRVVGFTATPYRLDSGRLDEGNGRLFDDIVYSYDLARAVKGGYLSPPISKGTKTEIDVRGVKRQGGEFNAGALEAAADKAEVIEGACDEMCALGAERRGWLVFCSGIDHALHVRDALRLRGIAADTVSSKTPKGERDRLIAAFKSGQIRALTNANLLTTGFDAPHVDLLCLLRPTLSTGLYVQMIGRGTRLCPGKTDCLVLDFAGNVRRHGPVDDVQVQMIKKKQKGEKPEKTDPDTVRAKICPVCQVYNSISVMTCTGCGFEWPKDSQPKHDSTADTAPILKANAPQWIPVSDVRIDRHRKFGDGPDSMVAEYECASGPYRQWVCWEHVGGARQRAEFWWLALGGKKPLPATIDEAMSRAAELHLPVGIKAKRDGKYWSVTDILAERPNGSRVAVNLERWNVKEESAA